LCEEGTVPCLAACEALAWVELKSRHAELDGGHGLDAARQGLVIDALLPEKRGGVSTSTFREMGAAVRKDLSLTPVAAGRTVARARICAQAFICQNMPAPSSLFPTLGTLGIQCPPSHGLALVLLATVDRVSTWLLTWVWAETGLGRMVRGSDIDRGGGDVRAEEGKSKQMKHF